MEDTLFSWKVIALVIIVILVGCIVAASTIGWLDFKELIQKVPLLGDIAGDNVLQEVDLKKENDRLKKQMAEQEKEIKQLNAQIKILQQIEQDLAENKAQAEVVATEENQRRENYRELAAYYAEMKPEAAVAIFNNLEQDAAAIILQAMPRDQAGKIFGAMDPKQAAELLKIMANLEPLGET